MILDARATWRWWARRGDGAEAVDLAERLRPTSC